MFNSNKSKSAVKASTKSILAFVKSMPQNKPADCVLAITNGLKLHDIKPEDMGPQLAALLAEYATVAALDLETKLGIIEALKYNVEQQRKLFGNLPAVFEEDLQDSEVDYLLNLN